ncbi:hypothetical protein [Allochromatium warmingii]|uniref:hypothetical protein n=1 Tax=Allochromatium warmingii TaxID=61595 RepID=UPI0011608B82|nr:hypothetical protein [Allochromatium warmingii]
MNLPDIIRAFAAVVVITRPILYCVSIATTRQPTGHPVRVVRPTAQPPTIVNHPNPFTSPVCPLIATCWRLDAAS